MPINQSINQSVNQSIKVIRLHTDLFDAHLQLQTVTKYDHYASQLYSEFQFKSVRLCTVLYLMHPLGVSLTNFPLFVFCHKIRKNRSMEGCANLEWTWK